MGKIRKGVLGGFSGKVGTVVGATRNGISYIRSLPASVRNPRTQAQKEQRARFAVASAFLKGVVALLKIGWRRYAVGGMTPFNAAMSYVVKAAISGSYPDYSVNPSKVFVSRGSLAPAFETELGVAGNAVLVKWDDNSAAGGASASDKALVAVINRVSGEAVTLAGAAERSAGRQEVSVPSSWLNCDLSCYLGFVSSDGRQTSNSVYMGDIVIVG